MDQKPSLSALGRLQPGLLWGQHSLPSCRPGSTCQQPEGRVNQGLINPEIWNLKKNADVFLKVCLMPRACWQRRTHGNSVYYPLEIASIPINTTVNLKKSDQFPRAARPPPQVAQLTLDKPGGQHYQTLISTLQSYVQSQHCLCMGISSSLPPSYL